MDINNFGQILARGFNGYYILTPVPEPVHLAALASVATLWRRERT